MTPDQVERWRADTPGCAGRVHLNNAGAGLMPASVLATIQSHLVLETEIGGYEAADARSREIDAVYGAIGLLVGAAARNVAVVASATAAFIQVLSSFDFAPGDAIVTTRSDYTSYQIQLLALARRMGVRVLHAADLPEGGVDPASVRELVRGSHCRLVTVSWIPTHSGLVQRVAEVGSVCAELGVPYHVDACQAVGQFPIDVKQLQCDYLSATARKFLRGPRGMGFLYSADRVLERGDHPLYIDMRGASWVAPDRYEVQPTARRYEDWEFPYALVLGLGAAAEYASAIGVRSSGQRAVTLGLREQLAAIPVVRVLDRGRDLCAIVTAEIKGRDARVLVSMLRERGVNAGATMGWYGLLDLGARGVETALRLSPHYYNTEGEIDAASAMIRELAS